MPPSEESRWFEEHVQPHEQALRAYLLRRFATVPDHDDLVQDTYLRMLRARWRVRLATTKAFLFATASHVAIDRFRRRRVIDQVSIDSSDEYSVDVESPNAAEICDEKHRQELLAEAVAGLPPRCREVMLLRYSDGLPCKEIARQLGVSPETVKSHLNKGVGDCIDFFQRHGMLEHKAASEGRVS